MEVPHCHPEQPTVASSAEAAVWDAMRGALPDQAAMFADVRLTHGTRECGADLVVAVPGLGVAVIEVAGGHVVHDSGSWTRSEAGGVRTIDPVGRAQRAQRALLDYLQEHDAWPGGPVRTAHLVAFPFATVPSDLQAIGCPRRLVMDHAQLAQPVRWLRDAFAAGPQDAPAPTAAAVDDLTECLLGRPGRRTHAADRPTADLLTASQAAVLDAVWHRETERGARRVEVGGGAGSGKTWLAVEQARRLTAAGARVALLARSTGLTRHLRRRAALLLPAERPALVGNVQDLGAPPGSLAAAAHFDALVVDEAQDVTEREWPALLGALADPAAGGLYLFTDDGRHAAGSTARPTVGLPPLRLDENLRSTKPIARTFAGLAGTQMRYRGGGGAPVQFVQAHAGQAVAAADEAAGALLEAGWGTGDVALLTTGSPHPEHSERLEDEGQDGYWDSFLDGGRFFHGQVLGFQGLERPAVVLAVNGFGDADPSREVLYVGLSRARDLLVVCGDLAEIRAVAGDAVARRLTAS